MIRFENVSKDYHDLKAVTDLNFVIPTGELVVLIGPSGCGMTTTLKMINRLIEPSGGRVVIDGQDIAGLDPQQLRRGIGYVIQSVGLFPHLTLKQNIQVVPDLLGWPRRKSAARADELLELVRLDPARHRDRYPRELSGGQQQRVGVARALAVDPPVLLMDEPFGAVDPLTRTRLQDEFLELQARLRKTVVMVTHDMDEAIRLGDRICLMNRGRIEQYGTPETLLSAPANEFVRRFVGSDRALRRLSRFLAGDVLEESSRNWSSAELGSALNVTDDVRKALGRMLDEGVTSLPVLDAGGQLAGQLSLERIIRLGAPAGEAP
jgi:osmoprotectant transport system ATP-binding protein